MVQGSSHYDSAWPGKRKRKSSSKLARQAVLLSIVFLSCPSISLPQKMSTSERFALVGLIAAAALAAADAASIVSCVDINCGATVVQVKDVVLGACTVWQAFSYKATATQVDVYSGSSCAPPLQFTLPVNKPTANPGGAIYLYQDLTGAIVGGIIGGLVLIALILAWRWRSTKTGPYADGMTWGIFLTCGKPSAHSVTENAAFSVSTGK